MKELVVLTPTTMKVKITAPEGKYWRFDSSSFYKCIVMDLLGLSLEDLICDKKH
jgi:hypothetical protein